MNQTLKQKIFNTLVYRKEERTCAQLAAAFKTSKGSVAARVSEIRDDGFAIYVNTRKDSKGRVKMFYRHSTPSRQMVRESRAWQRMIRG